MSDLYWLTDEQMAKLDPFFPKSHGKPRVDDRRVLSGIIFINRNGLRWRDAPEAYGPHKTLYSRWKRWSEKGIFARMMVGLAAEHGEEKTVMIDATYLKAHRTATSLAEKRGRGRLIGRTKGGMNTKLHAICDSQDARSACLSPLGRSAITSARGHCWAACLTSTGCSGTVATTPTGSRSLERQGDTRLHPRGKPQDHDQIRRASIKRHNDREHVRPPQGLATGGHTLRPLPQGLPLSHRPRCRRHLLVMNPDPSAGLRRAASARGEMRDSEADAAGEYAVRVA